MVEYLLKVVCQPDTEGSHFSLFLLLTPVYLYHQVRYPIHVFCKGVPIHKITDIPIPDR